MIKRKKKRFRNARRHDFGYYYNIIHCNSLVPSLTVVITYNMTVWIELKKKKKITIIRRGIRFGGVPCILTSIPASAVDRHGKRILLLLYVKTSVVLKVSANMILYFL